MAQGSRRLLNAVVRSQCSGWWRVSSSVFQGPRLVSPNGFTTPRGLLTVCIHPGGQLGWNRASENKDFVYKWHPTLSSTFCSPEFIQMATPNYKGGWQLQSSCVPRRKKEVWNSQKSLTCLFFPKYNDTCIMKPDTYRSTEKNDHI